jgi:hypothetical protein
LLSKRQSSTPAAQFKYLKIHFFMGRYKEIIKSRESESVREKQETRITQSRKDRNERKEKIILKNFDRDRVVPGCGPPHTVAQKCLTQRRQERNGRKEKIN